MENNQQKSWFLPASILLAAVLVSGALVYNIGVKKTVVGGGVEGEELVANVGEILTDAAKDKVILGDPNAPVTLLEFGDFQCPFCGKFHLESGELLREEYINTGKVKMVYVDLAFLGAESVQAAQAAHCAGDQDNYWAYHDYLYGYLWDNYYAQGKNGENVGGYSDANLKSFARELGLDGDKFDQCLDSGKYIGKVEAGSEYAQAVLGGRLSTPTIFVGEKLIQGAQPYSIFKQAIEEALKNS